MACETDTIEMVKELKIVFAQNLICSWVGALGLAAGAFCQTYVQVSLGDGRYGCLRH